MSNHEACRNFEEKMKMIAFIKFILSEFIGTECKWEATI